MFELGRIFTASELVNNSKRITSLLIRQPQPLLIMSKGGERFALLEAEMFGDLMASTLRERGLKHPHTSLRDRQTFRSADFKSEYSGLMHTESKRIGDGGTSKNRDRSPTPFPYPCFLRVA